MERLLYATNKLKSLAERRSKERYPEVEAPAKFKGRV